MPGRTLKTYIFPSVRVFSINDANFSFFLLGETTSLQLAIEFLLLIFTGREVSREGDFYWADFWFIFLTEAASFLQNPTFRNFHIFLIFSVFNLFLCVKDSSRFSVKQIFMYIRNLSTYDLKMCVCVFFQYWIFQCIKFFAINFHVRFDFITSIFSAIA